MRTSRTHAFPTASTVLPFLSLVMLFASAGCATPQAYPTPTPTPHVLLLNYRWDAGTQFEEILVYWDGSISYASDIRLRGGRVPDAVMTRLLALAAAHQPLSHYADGQTADGTICSSSLRFQGQGTHLLPDDGGEDLRALIRELLAFASELPYATARP